MKFYNTLSRKIEEFKPINSPHVGIYACGPTVYDFIHLGNCRSFTFYDVLRRALKINGYDVTFVQNITDIEDKIIKRSKEKGITPEELTQEYTKYFFDDLNKLNIWTADVSPKATEHIGKMVKYIEKLIEKGLAYIEKDGSVYFDISKFGSYGKLSQLEKREIKSGVRVLSDEYSKDDVQDFALWKTVKTEEFGYDSPWGKGRPGWHIECSVMSQEYLGETFDIHTGGVDLIFPHHENEIAQSEGKTGKPFVNYFLHGEHLLVGGEKMSKSKNNFYTLRDIEEKGFEPLAFKYLTLTAHYRDKLNFTWESLQAAQNALNNLREIIRNWGVNDVILGIRQLAETPESDSGQARLAEASTKRARMADEYYEKFMERVNNDLNTPQALALLWEMVKSDLPGSEKSTLILQMDKVLGLGFDEFLGKQIEIPEEVVKLSLKRDEARKNKDFEKSDNIRKEIEELGYSIEDSSIGSQLKKISN